MFKLIVLCWCCDGVGEPLKPGTITKPGVNVYALYNSDATHHYIV